jgi:hypothetical protein
MPENIEATRPQALDEHPADLEHPRGTLVIVGIFGLLFGLGWLGMYFFMFLERGAPHH